MRFIPLLLLAATATLAKKHDEDDNGGSFRLLPDAQTVVFTHNMYSTGFDFSQVSFSTLEGSDNTTTSDYVAVDILIFSVDERHTKPSSERPASEGVTGCDSLPRTIDGSCDYTYYGVGVRDDVDHAISWCDKEQHVHLAPNYVGQHLTVQVPTNSSTWADVVPHRVNVRGVSAICFVYCGNGPTVLTKGKIMSKGGLINARNFSSDAHDTSPAFIMGMVISGFIIFYRLRRYFGCIESMAAVSYDHARRDETELLATNYVRLDSVA